MDCWRITWRRYHHYCYRLAGGSLILTLRQSPLLVAPVEKKCGAQREREKEQRMNKKERMMLRTERGKSGTVQFAKPALHTPNGYTYLVPSSCLHVRVYLIPTHICNGHLPTHKIDAHVIYLYTPSIVTLSTIIIWSWLLVGVKQQQSIPSPLSLV